MSFTIAGDLSESEVIATGCDFRAVKRLSKMYGAGRWRNLKGAAAARLATASVRSPSCIDGDIRVVDESEEDCAYPAAGFDIVKCPQEVQHSCLHAA